MCSVLGIYSMMLCLGFGVIGNFVDLYDKKKMIKCVYLSVLLV